jgi:hypothetical protein
MFIENGSREIEEFSKVFPTEWAMTISIDK